MKKVLVIILMLAMLSAVVLPFVKVWAIGNNESMDFFKVNETEIAVGDTLEMTIDLNSIKYTDFTFTLQSDYNVENVEIEELDETDVIPEYDEEEMALEIGIDKTKIDISEIKLYYKVPDTVKVGDVITFLAMVTNNEVKKVDTAETENIIESTEKESEEIMVEVTIIGKNEDIGSNVKIQDDLNLQGKENEEIKDSVETQENTNLSDKTEANTTKSQQSTASTQVTVSTSKSVGMSNSSTAQTVTYNGSDNNYLSNLYVNGYEFTKTFSKENSTYFMTVSSDVDALDITAEIEDSGATVCIYGNDNLASGTNKVLISVTAENGNVRYYRVFVIKAS